MVHGGRSEGRIASCRKWGLCDYSLRYPIRQDRGCPCGGAGLGPDTWIFLGVSVIALMTAVACAAMCLWSLHGGVGAEFARLGVNPDNPASYRPEVLWYFGHLANLKPDAAVEMLRRSDRTFEMDTLSYNVVDLAQKVLRKHRWVSAGWAFTALALIALVAAGVSFFVQARF